MPRVRYRHGVDLVVSVTVVRVVSLALLLTAGSRLINFENRQAGPLAAKALMKAGGVIDRRGLGGGIAKSP